MIWLVFILLLALAAFLVTPALFRPSSVTAKDALTRELAASKHQLSQIDAEVASGFLDEEGAGRARRAMERRILKLGDRLDALNAGKDEPALPTWMKFAVPATIIVVSAGLYPLVGDPFYTPNPTNDRNLSPEEQAIADMTPAGLEAMLIQRIEQSGQGDPTGYVFLGRIRMDMGKYDEALSSYETALNLSQNHPQIVSEYNQALAFVARQRGEEPPSSSAPQIDDQDVQAMNELSADQQQERIRGMVDGLAARLQDDPNDLQGWLRLIRARTVLGETDLAAASLSAARTTFEGDSEALSALNQLGDELGLDAE
ncbi:MAG: c-type cytochrome biogenesis protein CcmI [Ponticaulis sp.]|nr:c-type cytochrome biogenesis protein CcmI [Ponticaulis sp.]|tara:strand:+ start:23172 stop:24113 length:942 start_codon:yes stop_codon:yes gene_type:complete